MFIALTSGEPSGIGPDIVLILAQQERHEDLNEKLKRCQQSTTSPLFQNPINTHTFN